MSDLLDRLEHDAPNLVAPFRALDDARFMALRREVRRLAGAGNAPRLVREHAGLVPAAQLAAIGRWPTAAPTGVPGVPGPPDADSGALREQLERLVRPVGAALS